MTDALFGLLAISIVSNDQVVSSSVLTELEKCSTYSTDIFYWIGGYHEFIGNNKAARANYLKSCHQYPNSQSCWNHLLKYFLKSEPDSAVYALRRINSISGSSAPEKVDIYIESMYLKGLYLYCTGSITDSYQLLKKSFHLRPSPKILAALYFCQTTDAGRHLIQIMLKSFVDSNQAQVLLAKLPLCLDKNNLKEAKSIITHLENSADKEANLEISILFYYLQDYERALTFIYKYLNTCLNINGLEVKYLVKE